MRFKNYINESIMTQKSKKELKDFIINDIKKDCQYYLKISNEDLYRGMHISNQWGFKKVRKNRKPMGTDDESFKIINDYFEKKGIIRRDNAVMCTTNLSSIKNFGFGSPYVIYPIGKFNYSWIENTDFNDTSNYDYDETRTFLEYGVTRFLNKKQQKIALEELEIRITTNKGLRKAMKKRYEIWFDSNYYYINKTIFDYLKLDEYDILKDKWKTEARQNLWDDL